MIDMLSVTVNLQNVTSCARLMHFSELKPDICSYIYPLDRDMCVMAAVSVLSNATEKKEILTLTITLPVFKPATSFFAIYQLQSVISESLFPFFLTFSLSLYLSISISDTHM